MKTVFINASVLDVENRTVLDNCAVTAEDGIITAVGGTPETDGAQVVDLSGKTITPGLFNCHIHMTMSPVADQESEAHASLSRRTMIAMKHMEEYIESGVTFVRDVGSHGDIAVEMRNAVSSGLVKKAPDLQVSGNCICMTGGHGWTSVGVEADGVDGCRKATRLQLRSGADWIKVMATGGVMTRGVEPGSPQLNIDELKACVEEAHKVGAKVCTHAQGLTGIRNALLAGIDCIEHACFLDDENIRLLKENGGWTVFTLCAPYFINEYAMGAGIPDYVIRKNNLVNEAHQNSFRRAFAEGINMALGTDAGTPFNPHSGTGMELVLMVRYGLTPMDALVIGTINSARLCGVDDVLGSITVGKKAHFAVFDENPVDNIETVTNCVMTVKNGEILYRK